MARPLRSFIATTPLPLLQIGRTAPTGCSSSAPPKAATLNRKIRRCGDCGRYYIPDAAYTRPSAADQERGLARYEEGVALSAMARTFGVTPPVVSRPQ